MAVTAITIPPDFAPAYKPVEWSFISDLFPNVTTDVGFPIFAITVADQGAVDAIPGLNFGDIFMVLGGQGGPPSFQAGQTILIQGTDNARYDGVVRILNVPQNGVYVLDATNTDGAAQGTASLYYEAYALFADVQFVGDTEPQRYRIDAAPDGTFTLDIRDKAQRTFSRPQGDVFNRVRVDSPLEIVEAEGAITAPYTINISEGFNAPVNGVNEYVIKPSGFIQPGGKFRNVVNAVQPYHHYNEFTGGVDLDWDRNLVDYIMDIGTTGQRVKRFLTYAPDWDGRDRGILVGPDEAYFLGFLHSGRPGIACRLDVVYYNGSTFLSNQQVSQVLPSSSGIIPIGPRNINPPAGTTRYIFTLRNGSGQPISRAYQFNIDPKCHKAPRRLYALNKFGAIDAFTFTGYERRENMNQRSTVQRDTMRPNIGKYGSWQRKTWANKPRRMFSIISDTLTKAWLRYVADEILESPDVRTSIHEPILLGDGPWWTPVILENDIDNLGFEHGRLSISYSLGIDEQVQTR
jgi:hypothetical protein